MSAAGALVADSDRLALPRENAAFQARVGAMPATADAVVVMHLATLPPLEYDRVRKAEAERLGVRAETLDGAVRAARGEAAPDSAAGDSVLFQKPEPWPTPVSGAVLLTDLTDIIRRFVILPQHADTSVALWIVFTYCIDAAQVAPILAVTSPEKRCGKTTLLDLLTRLASRALPSSNISAAALFRAVEKWQPTLIIDEADAFLRDSEELRGVLNSGHTRPTAFVIRTSGDDFEPRRFSTWGAKAIAIIGKLPDTLQDRSIVIELRRKLSAESAEKLRHVDLGELEQLTRRITRWATDHGDAVGKAMPVLPRNINDRAADNWEPMMAIANLAGGKWPERAQEAAVALSGNDRETPSTNQELLQDIGDAFALACVNRLATADLILALCRDEEKPWATYNRGKPISARQVAKRLSEFGIVPHTVRIPNGTAKGYKRESFDDAFARYLGKTLVTTVTSPQPSNGTACDGIAIRNIESVTNSSVTPEATPDKACVGVTDKEPNSGDGSAEGDSLEVFDV